MHFGCISGRVLKFSALSFSGDLAALVYIDENRLLKRLDSGDSGIRFKAAYPRKRQALGKAIAALISPHFHKV
jgi:hypothetical protein